MSARKWGVLHPGAMGSSVVACLAATGHEVLWCSAGRGSETRQRAHAAGARDVPALDQLVAESDVIVSVCPPGAAEAVARSVAGLGFDGCYVEANAIAPSTARTIAGVLAEAGATVVDGGIVGPPAWSPDTTRLFVSGPDHELVAAALSGSPLEVVAIDGGVGSASALKVAYASWTKAVGAALLAIRAYADAEGVADVLLAEWSRSQPGTIERSELTATAVGPKAWRFGDELRQLALAMDDVGLPGGFQAAAAEIFDRLAPLKDTSEVHVDQVVTLLGGGGPGDGAR
ncbi:MAG: DUF1932 domain-containing protein [Acidimicrobiales bacterium]